MAVATHEKLETLASQYGFSVEELLEEYGLDAACFGAGGAGVVERGSPTERSEASDFAARTCSARRALLPCRPPSAKRCEVRLAWFSKCCRMSLTGRDHDEHSLLWRQ
ncbi:MAG: hypothetical protein QOF89_1105 [Acidobacteriota bacterium]|jgi:hypothetical protein|nr:hypothetical protein [Acidobacteriota bacterium]